MISRWAIAWFLVFFSGEIWAKCPPQSTPLFFITTPSPPNATPEYSSYSPVNSAGALTRDLEESLVEILETNVPKIGYCLVAGTWSQFPDLDQSPKMGPIIQIRLQIQADSLETTGLITVGILKDETRDSLTMDQEGFPRPLCTLPYTNNEALSVVLAQKIKENLNDRFICHLSIDSKPPNINFTTNTGITGNTPMEIVVPIGSIDLSASAAGYLPYRISLPLDAPGNHKHHIDLRPRRFYHSKWMFAVAASLVSGAVSYWMEDYYYTQYSNLGEADLNDNPEKFSKTFENAKNWERGKFLSLAGVTLFFSLSFLN